MRTGAFTLEYKSKDGIIATCEVLVMDDKHPKVILMDVSDTLDTTVYANFEQIATLLYHEHFSKWRHSMNDIQWYEALVSGFCRVYLEVELGRYHNPTWIYDETISNLEELQ